MIPPNVESIGDVTAWLQNVVTPIKNAVTPRAAWKPNPATERNKSELLAQLAKLFGDAADRKLDDTNRVGAGENGFHINVKFNGGEIANAIEARAGRRPPGHGRQSDRRKRPRPVAAS